MSLHHEYLSPTQRASLSHRMRFLANINARAEARKLPPVIEPPVIAPPLDDVAFGPMVRSLEDVAFGPVIERPKRPDVKQIIGATADYFKVGRIDIMSDRRDAAIVRPRHVAMYLARHLTARSLPDIGRRFGGRDHSTILNAVRSIGTKMLTEADLAFDVAYLTAQIGGEA